MERQQLLRDVGRIERAVAGKRTIIVTKARGTVQIAGLLSRTAGHPEAPTPHW
jgi:hypothetical protein